MKKIISLVCVVAMLIATMAISASAFDGAYISFDVTDNGSGSYSVDVVFNANGNDEVWALTSYIDVKPLTDVGATVSSAGKNGVTSKYTKSKNYVSVTYTDTNMATYIEDGTVIATITITGLKLTSDFTFQVSENTKGESYTDYTKGNGSLGMEAAQIKAGSGDESLKLSESGAIENATALDDGKTTDAQIGAALWAKFKAPSVNFEYKWAIDLAGERVYSNDPFAVKGVMAGSDCTVAATFINGVHANEFGVEEKSAMTIGNVDVIVKDAEGKFYLSNEEDAKNKGEAK